MAHFLIVDASSILHRCYHAINGSRPPEARLGSGTGIDHNAVSLACSRLIDRLARETAQHKGPIKALMVAFEGKQTWRSDLYPPYKAHRERSEILRVFLDNATSAWQREIEQRGMYWYQSAEHEADDTAATIARLIEEDGDTGTVVSSDRDLLQCITDEVSVLLVKSARDTPLYEVKNFMHHHRFQPTSLPDYKALVGDTADNLPGVHGIGPVAATTLIEQFATLDEVYNNLWKVSSGVSAKLKRQRDEAFMFRSIATVRRDVPITL